MVAQGRNETVISRFGRDYRHNSIMSLSGLRKQFNKANQYLSETMGAAEPTKLDEQYNEMEKHIDTTYELISALIAGTNEYLQPNPATRAKMATMGAISKVRGTVKTSPYPQTEGMLADTMYKYGTALGDSSDLGKALLEAAEAYRHMADIKYQMEENVKQNFIDPLTHLQNNELKDVNHHRTKLKGRRLDYDCKKRQQRRDEELIQAEEKLEESKRLAEMAMFNVLSNDVEQVSQLRALVDAQLDFHRQTTQSERSELPSSSGAPPSASAHQQNTPFQLNLKEGQVVELVAQVDENWFEGRLNGKNGLFPIAYVQVLVPLR
ncbi:BAR domain protein [Teladorsagia circumcincta]|uniref:BAR domain protein n=1 Tax=Teladorsagia circumcincta TaxID=45464 RepID=A0A2G9V2Q6_TELCI|nr:BAR domain protein [Teladorsagia circumcincta]